ncbi:MAG: PTS glucose transporter subunit IIA, partial [Mogibacterium sp.]|nr:PTS glucose transporter subunit IIA [Mogibacterium sp.]
MSRMLILSPLDGRVIPLEEVPDEVFAEKVLGDGAAVIPENGNIYSPIDGEIVAIPESLHAYGIRSDAGIEMIVHFGLETVNLKGEGFSPKVKVGDRVKAGQLLCTADMDFLKSKGINTVTPVLVTDGAEEGSFSVKTGEIRHGEEIMTAEISADAAAAADGDAQKAASSDAQPAGKAAAAAPSAKKKFPIDFDFLQKLGKSLMTVIAVMPAAGLMISLGNILTMCFPAGFGLMAGNTMAQIGWAIIGNLHILFAAAIGGSWAKE